MGTNAEGLAGSVDLVCLLLLPVCAATGRIGAEEDVDHELEDARGCYGGGGTTACGTVGAAVLESRKLRSVYVHVTG